MVFIFLSQERMQKVDRLSLFKTSCMVKSHSKLAFFSSKIDRRNCHEEVNLWPTKELAWHISLYDHYCIGIFRQKKFPFKIHKGCASRNKLLYGRL